VSDQAPTMIADVAVIGGGPAGIAATVILAEAGRRVALLDESPDPGGQVWRRRRGALPPAAARPWLVRLDRSGATLLRACTVIDVRDDAESARFDVLAEQGVAPVAVRAATLLFATGARERFLPFPGWTLPGVVGVGGAQALLKGGLDVAGKRVVIAGSGPLLLPVASSLAAAGAQLLLVAEQASRANVTRFARGLWRAPSSLVQAARYRTGFLRTSYAMGTWVTSARGDGRVQEVTITDGRSERTMPCDVLCAAFGLVPDRRLAALIGSESSSAGVRVDDEQRTSHPRAFAVGETTGIGGVEKALAEARIAAAAILGQAPSRALLHRRAALHAMAKRMDVAFALRDELRRLAVPDTIVCRCEDVAVGALRRDWTTRQTKLYTRTGMGPCQGRVCGPALEFLHGWPEDSARAPIAPALVSTLIGRSSGHSVEGDRDEPEPPDLTRSRSARSAPSV
jgi:NADPH-dependent 2,4-dienoyl-CoA reductase/sulfur reductase-like enzyme